jgi:hypothetical protein
MPTCSGNAFAAEKIAMKKSNNYVQHSLILSLIQIPVVQFSLLVFDDSTDLDKAHLVHITLKIRIAIPDC